MLPSQLEHVSGRDVAALQDARPATLIGARSDEGEVCFATVIWVTPISHSPALVAFALREKSHTMGIIKQAGCFSISAPPADEQGVRLIELCGANTGRLMDKGAAVPHELIELQAKGEQATGERTAGEPKLVPVPLHVCSWVAGTVRSIQEEGDHLLVIGEVTRAATCAPRDGRGQLTPYDTLLCVQHGAYAAARAL